MKDYERYDAVGLAELVRQGAVSAAELLRAAIARIDDRNESLNAVIAKDYAAAMTQAQRPLEIGRAHV